MFSEEKGLTLIEVMISLFIITVGVLGAFTIIQRAVPISSLNASKLEAFYLAQEGMEMIRNRRDDNWLADEADGPPEDSIPWDRNIPEGDVQLDYPTFISGGVDCGSSYLVYDGGLHYYICTGESHKYKRVVTVVKPETYQMNVYSHVWWTEKGQIHQITLEERLYDWWKWW